MEEIITVGNQQYKMETSSSLTQTQRNEVIRQLSTQQINGCKSCGNSNNIKSLGTGSCTTTIPLVKGKSRIVRCTASSTNTNPSFTYTLTVVGATGSPFTFGPTTLTTHDFTVPFPSTATTDLTLSVSDGCAGGTPDTATCTATLVDPVVTNFTVTPSSCTVQIGGTTCTLSPGSCTDQAGNSMICTAAIWSAVAGTGTISVSSGVVTGLTVGSATARCVIGTKTVDTPITVTAAACTTPSCGFTIS